MKILVPVCILALLVVLLAGCGFTTQGDVFRETVKSSGAQVYDEGLANSQAKNRSY